MRTVSRFVTTAAALGLLFIGPGALVAQDKPAPPAVTQGASNVKRTPLQKFDVPGSNFETVIAMVEIVPNVAIGRHTHPGIESAYLLEGDIVLKVAGQPDKALKAGESWQIPVGVIHDATTGAQGAKVVVTYVVEKGKPLASPAN
jgi:quercetin dioxygenase-like cupin family protein